jgi:hypothetical protein
MSGGHFNYAYRDMEDIAMKLCNEPNPLHKAFGRHLHLVAKALHDVEWVLSGDYGDDQEIKAIEKVLQSDMNKIMLGEMIIQAKELIPALQQAIENAKS